MICRDVVVAVLSLKAFDQGSGVPETLFIALIRSQVQNVL